MRRQFGKTIVDLGILDSSLILITGDVEQNMDDFKAMFPDRFFNFGLCEQSIVSLSGGLALMGFKPVVYSITPFILERAFEQIKIDIDENNLPVMLMGYDDYPHHGPTHRALNAPEMVKLFKNIISFFPENNKETKEAMEKAHSLKCPTFIKLKRDNINIVM